MTASAPLLYNPVYQVIHGDSRDVLKAFNQQVDLIVTSPPYADARKQYANIHPDAYPEWFASFHEAFWQALKPTGSLVINIKDKVVEGVRHRYAWKTLEKLTELGWYCIDDYIWHKKNAMPGYWPSRLRDSWEYCFHLAKSKRPYIDQDAVRVPIKTSTAKRMQRLQEKDFKRRASHTGSGFGKTLAHWQAKTHVLPGNVLWLAAETRNQQHPAVFPVELPRFFIQLLSPENGLVVDPFAGSGTTGIAALALGRQVLLIDNNYDYCRLSKQRLEKKQRLISK